MSIPNSVDMGEINDGYHTFNELYAHRIELFLALCRMIASEGSDKVVWKSRLHSDGTSLDGWFVLGIFEDHGSQITYHLPDARWDDADCDELDRAPMWDGHTSNDVLQRLKQL